MSIVVATKRDDLVMIGSDRAISYKTSVHFGGPKYAFYDRCVVGFVGSTRYLGCARDFFDDADYLWLPDANLGEVYKHVSMPLRTLLLSEEQVYRDGDTEYCQGEIMFINSQGIYLIDSGFGVTACESSVACLGSPEQLVKGYIEAVNRYKLEVSDEELIEGAIEAACKYDTCCDGFSIDLFRLK